MTQRSNVMILKSSSREWLQDAMEYGLLSEEAESRCRRVLKEDDALRRENAYLNGIIQAQKKTIRSFQAADLEAKKYMFEKQEGHRQGRSFRLIVGGSMAALGVLTLMAIYNLVALWWM